ncbi:MAG: complex I NDUFA9 subunit family protein [Rhodoferax sp.]
MKNVLVIGGTGFVGTQVCQRLVAQGWRVSVPTRRRAHAGGLQFLPRLSVHELDVHDPQALARLLPGHHALVNLVAILHGTPAEFGRVHVELVRSLAGACVAAGLRRVVHVSAIGADFSQPDAAPSLYLRSKSRGEALWAQAAEGAALDLTMLRPSVIFGRRDKFLNVFANLQAALPVLPLAGAQARFQPVWVQDVASAVLRCLQGSSVVGSPAALPAVVEACGPEVFTLAELVRLAGQLRGVNLGRGRPVLALPDWLARWQARLMEMAPGEPVMSRDNLDSMRVPNVASGTLPGLQALGIAPSALRSVAQAYLAGAR